MLRPEDHAMIERLVKEAKEVPNFNPDQLFNLFLGGDFSILYYICVDDDGKIDSEEDALLHWFIRDFEPQLSDPYNRDEAVYLAYGFFFA